MADSLGNCIHLNERDCSLQRRHQKVIEEAPSPAVTPAIRSAMGEAAVQAAKAVDYEGAGTVEFLLSERGEFFFLEMNTRLQVEHPVTEMITGVDLVQKQFEVAAGMPLGLTQSDIGITGHAMEARIYAEDPSKGFLPAIGDLAMWREPAGPGIRVDTGVREGDAVTVEFDPMLAKLIVHAPTRTAAARRLDNALANLRALGVTTNIGFLRQMAQHPDFTSGGITTDYLDSRNISDFAEPEANPATLVAIAAAASRFGLDRLGTGGSSQSTTDEHTGHAGDPFRTLSRSFP
jgi:acetyl/propionyl-CoA carboxylase alpha subunit